MTLGKSWDQLLAHYEWLLVSKSLACPGQDLYLQDLTSRPLEGWVNFHLIDANTSSVRVSGI